MQPTPSSAAAAAIPPPATRVTGRVHLREQDPNSAAPESRKKPRTNASDENTLPPPLFGGENVQPPRRSAEERAADGNYGSRGAGGAQQNKSDVKQLVPPADRQTLAGAVQVQAAGDLGPLVTQEVPTNITVDGDQNTLRLEAPAGGDYETFRNQFRGKGECGAEPAVITLGMALKTFAIHLEVIPTSAHAASACRAVRCADAVPCRAVFVP